MLSFYSALRTWAFYQGRISINVTDKGEVLGEAFSIFGGYFSLYLLRPLKLLQSSKGLWRGERFRSKPEQFLIALH
jgi:hypothetical protein